MSIHARETVVGQPIEGLAPRVLVIGHGMVAQRFLELIDVHAGLLCVDVLSEEPRPAYDRVGLSNYFVHGDEQSMSLAPEGFFESPHIRLHLDESAVSIDREQRTVLTSEGREFSYDTLVLAMGSAPFVPSVPGVNAEGVFVYRTLDDLELIRARAQGARTGVVIGGGLLGLEAANAVSSLGLTAHVVELAERLMPAQLDLGGATMLRRRIEEMGIEVHLSTQTQRILETEAEGVVGLEVSDVDGPRVIVAELVVVSAGIRPRDALAREAGLEIGERGGVVVDPWCRTSDPAVFAIGEVACAVGKTWGLVAPGYQMAQVAARQIKAMTEGLEAETGDGFLGADMSTKLKLLGVDVASIGDAHAAEVGALELTWSDPVTHIYKKVVVSDDGLRVLGAVLVGDADAYDSLRPIAASGVELPGSVEALLFPATGAIGIGPNALPDSAAVCSCNNISKGEITGAVVDLGACDVAAIKACTRAGTSCGSCVPMIQSLVHSTLERQGITVDKSLCEHFAYTRRELFDIIRVRQLTKFSQIIREIGQGGGCDICKPVIASILSTQAPAHVLEGENATLQDTNDHVMANLQRNGTYSVVPRLPGGEVTPEGLIAIGEIARDFGLYTKVTGGQRIDMFGARLDQLPEIWRRLVAHGFESGHAYGKSLRTVKSCVGSDWCRYGVQDSVGLAVELELRYRGLRSPHKLKSAVSGCARECAEAQSKDFGVIATEKGWNLYVGGNGGMRPRHADLLASDLDTSTLIRYIDRYLMYYVRTAERLQRTSVWLESLTSAEESGLAHLQRVIIEDALGLGDELEADMARHVGSYADEWAQTLEDPEKLARFRTFLNSEENADPLIQYVPNRAQHRPAVVSVEIPSRDLTEVVV
ncbi:MAG: nitrite reductase large subunit NirB [Actinomycetota bacterium]|nr:nitrite reductase large subunit NirB [Actinomycetota bacterium]